MALNSAVFYSHYKKEVDVLSFILRVVFATILFFCLAAVSAASAPRHIEPIPQQAFQPVVIASAVPIIVDTFDVKRKIVVPDRPVQPKPKPKAESKVKPKAETRQVRGKGGTIKGRATWYCKAGVSICRAGYPDTSGKNYYAAAGPALRRLLGPNYIGKYIIVSKGDVSIKVKVVDKCACKKGKPGERMVDLYWDAFDALGNPSRGEMTVKIRKAK